MLPATINPRATQEIDLIIKMIEGLIEKGFAYPLEGDVYFRVDKDPDYGKLSGRRLDDMQAGARIDVDNRKENPMDFALWKASKPGEPAWGSIRRSRFTRFVCPAGCGYCVSPFNFYNLNPYCSSTALGNSKRTVFCGSTPGRISTCMPGSSAYRLIDRLMHKDGQIIVELTPCTRPGTTPACRHSHRIRMSPPP